MSPADCVLPKIERAGQETDPSTYDAIIGSLRDAPAGRPFVVGQLGQSLDGRIATANGLSRDINGPDALDHLHRLRANVDAVLVGAGTILADDPQLNVRRTGGPQPRARRPRSLRPDARTAALAGRRRRPAHRHIGRRARAARGM